MLEMLLVAAGTCGDVQPTLDGLVRDHGETLLIALPHSDDHATVLTFDPKDGSWTLMWMMNDRICIVDSGEDGSFWTKGGEEL